MINECLYALNFKDLFLQSFCYQNMILYILINLEKV